jgi:hypothetical protein
MRNDPGRLVGTMARDPRDPRRWTEHAALQERLRGRFHEVQAAVAELATGTVRASSLVENLNSRLRSYFLATPASAVPERVVCRAGLRTLPVKARSTSVPLPEKPRF